MATWLKLTEEHGDVLHINFDNVTYFTGDAKRGAAVFLSGRPDDDMLKVEESAEQIQSLLDARSTT